MPIQLWRFAVVALLLCGALQPGQAQNADRGGKVILVSGATGTQGGAVARALVERGYAVRGLSRDPRSDASQALVALGVQVVRGDFDDPASLDAALAGAYGAFSVQQYRGIGVEAEIRQSKAFADAAKRAGIRHFVYTSVLYAHLGTGVPQFESKREIEDHIRSLDLPYSIVRPASLMSNLEAEREAVLRGTYRTPFPAALGRLYIAPADIGRVVAEAFDHPETWLGRALDLAGQRISFDDLAAAMRRVTGRPVVYEQIPWAEYTATATPTAVARETWFIHNHEPADLEALHQEFPWLQSVEDYLRSAGWAELGR